MVGYKKRTSLLQRIPFASQDCPFRMVIFDHAPFLFGASDSNQDMGALEVELRPEESTGGERLFDPGTRDPKGGFLEAGRRAVGGSEGL